MLTIDLNCDMGEGLSNDAQLMPYISSANIACGYHAGDVSIMRSTLALCVQYQVAVGAHPGFADKENFGRTEMQLPLAEIFQLVTQQVHQLQTLANALGIKLHHVKPHGALYNMSAKDPSLAAAIAQAVYDINPKLILFGLSGSHSISEGKKLGLKTASEVFADRTYCDDGSLTPRSLPNALIDSDEACLQQVLQMIQHKTVTATNGKQVTISAETLCLHGDGMLAVDFAKQIYTSLQENHIHIQSIQP